MVTGATYGLGMSMATGHAKTGEQIIIDDLMQEKLDIAIAQYAADGLQAHGYLFDVTNEAAVMQHIELIEKEVEPIDILVNNAGIIKRTTVSI